MSKNNPLAPQKTANKKQKISVGSIFSAALMIGICIILGGITAARSIKAQESDEFLAFVPLTLKVPPTLESYDEDFTDNIDPWAARRWSAGPDYEIKHNDGCDDGHCGFLEMKVKNAQAYVIASPMAAVDAPFAYKVTTRAKLLNRDDGDAYSMIIGGNWLDNGCPGQDFTTCFTGYYEFRVRYRDDNGDKFLEWKLKKVEGHDENNQNFGPDIIEWKRLDNVDPDTWVKWDVEVHNNGQLYIFANNAKQAGSAKDDTYIRKDYFGLMARSGVKGNTHVIFDFMRIK